MVDNNDDDWCHYSGMPSPMSYMKSKEHWNMIPTHCEYNGKVYRILNIDIRNSSFTLQDLEDDVDMSDCNVVVK